jgi:hypothetical protein
VPSYLTAQQAETRLDNRFGIEAFPLVGDLDAASAEVDAMGPFIGTKLVTDGTQTLAFPRSLNPDGTENEATTAPDAVLDLVALLAARSVTEYEPVVTSRSRSGLSESYSYPVAPRTERLIENNYVSLRPYLLKMGRSVADRTVLTESD